MKKSMKALALTLAAALLLTLSPAGGPLTAKAAGPSTYSVKYSTAKGWQCQPGSTFSDSAGSGDIDYLRVNLKDGDSLVVYSGDAFAELDVSSFKLGNLTVHQNAKVAAITGGIKDCYVLAGAYCAINGAVTNAYLYDSLTCTFNNDVLDMTLYVSDNSPQDATSLSCAGTVGRFYVYSTNQNVGKNVFYNVKSNSLVKGGAFWMPSDKYSPTPTEEYTKAMAGASTSTAPAASDSSASDSADEYDKVPKTGDSSPWLWLILAAAAGAGSLALRRKIRSLA